nr:U5 small nuclear ribonucleoprotein 116 kDa subunit [Cryptomonas paramecium]
MLYDDYGNLHYSYEIANKNIKRKKIPNTTKWTIKSVYTKNFLIKNLVEKNKKTRNICIVGHLHHGKSTFINSLSSSVHLNNQTSFFCNFSDFFYLEKQKAMSLQSSVTNLLLCNKKKESYLITLIDCPGHFDFIDQILTGIKISDGALLVIDISEGVLAGTEFFLKNCLVNNLPIVIILNAFDRLILEYTYSTKMIQKIIIKILDELNSILETLVFKKKKKENIFFFNPIQNNVCFASFLQNWSFTLNQYADMYISCQPSTCLSIVDLSAYFWNNFHYKDEFKLKKKLKIEKKTIFSQFILEPLYKLTFLKLGEPLIHIQMFIQNELGIFGNQNSIKNSQQLFENIFLFFFGGCRNLKLIPNHIGLISSVIEHIPHFIKTKKYKKNFIKKKYTFKSLCYVYKFFSFKQKNNFLNLVRILKGRLKRKTNVSLITEGHEFYLAEFFCLNCKIKNIFLPIGQYNLKLTTFSRGLITIVQGIDKKVRKTAILFRNNIEKKCFFNIYFSFLKKLSGNGLYSFLAVSLEPVYFFNLKKFYNSLKKSVKNYIMSYCEIDEFGKLFLHGIGQLYLDCMLHDIQFCYNRIDVNVSDILLSTKQTAYFKGNPIKLKVDHNIKLKLVKNCQLYTEPDQDIKHKFFPTLKKNLCSFYWNKFKKCINSASFIKNCQKNYSTDMTKLNSTCFIGPNSETYSCCLSADHEIKTDFCLVKSNLKWNFDTILNKNHSLFCSLYKLKFKLEKKKIFSEFSAKNLFRKYNYFFNELVDNYNWVVCEPSCISEISFDFRFFSSIVKSIRCEKGRIFSSNFLTNKMIFTVKYDMFFLNLINLISKINLLTNDAVVFSSFFDSWKEKFFQNI